MDRGTIWRVWLPLAAGLLALGIFFNSGRGPHGPARWIGLLLSLIGLAGVILARHTLGRSFSIAPKATALVTSGIYSRIRNPIYISGEIFLIGVVLMLWRPALLIILLALIPVQIIRARREAAVLEAKFGDAYREYRKHTWF
jgi:protein-S-isoprenylcysteine O-methyltransferase Ste14